MSFSNRIFSVRSACILLALLEIFDNASTISDMRVEWTKIKGTEEKESDGKKNIFGILFLIHHVNAGLNILGVIISSSLLYGVISEKQHFLSPSLYYFPLNVILTSMIVIIVLLLKIPDLDPIRITVGYVFTVLLRNLTWFLTILYKQQIQEQEKEKLA